MATTTFKEVAPYQSQYGDAINKLTDAVVNRQQFTYDPNTDASYKAYAKQYGRLGDRARINTLGDYAANTGGYASTAAVSAAQQAQNDYNQQLSNMIPSLMQAAYDRYQGEYNMNLGTLQALGSRDDSMYNRWNDNRNYNRDVFESDRNYNRDVFESDRTYNYNKSIDDRDYKYKIARDKVADSQWAKEFGLDKEKFAWSKQQGNSGSGGGSGRSGGGRSGSGRSGGSGGSGGGGGSVSPAAVSQYAGQVAAAALSGNKPTGSIKNSGLGVKGEIVASNRLAAMRNALLGTAAAVNKRKKTK